LRTAKDSEMGPPSGGSREGAGGGQQQMRADALAAPLGAHLHGEEQVALAEPLGDLAGGGRAGHLVAEQSHPAPPTQPDVVVHVGRDPLRGLHDVRDRGGGHLSDGEGVAVVRVSHGHHGHGPRLSASTLEG
jgi:hypothetical protein